MDVRHLLPFLLFLSTLAPAQVIPFTDPRWVIQSQGHLIENYQGQASLYLQNGVAYLKGEQFLNGTIEFDIQFPQRPSFSGMMFRMVDLNNFEDFYFRPHQSGNPDAFQYTPVFNGDPAWQLYHDPHDVDNNGYISWKPRGAGRGYNGVYAYAFDRWFHVKMTVQGTRAALYLDRKPEPVVVIHELLRGEQAGMLGLESNFGAARFANFSFSPTVDPPVPAAAPTVVPAPAGAIMQWQVSSAFKEDKVKTMSQLDPAFVDKLTWKTLTAEPTGLANLSRLAVLSDSTNTVLVRLTIRSESDQLKRLDFGYSDRVRAYCNGRLLFTGNNGFRSRDYRYLGTIGWFDALYLPLQKGENTVVLAVSESFGGWGVMGRMEEN